MNCSQIEILLLEDLKSKLAGADRAAFERHLASCEGCRQRAEGFRSVSQVLDDWDTPEISPWFNARLRQRIAAEEALGWNWQRALGWLKQPATAAAFATILAVGSLTVWVARPAVQPAPAPVVAEGHQVDELNAVVDDFDMLANFDVITDLKADRKKSAGNKKSEM